jgi:hypothetical protein
MGKLESKNTRPYLVTHKSKGAIVRAESKTRAVVLVSALWGIKASRLKSKVLRKDEVFQFHRRKK